MKAPESRQSKSVSGQIAYCGLWCGSCSYGNGTISDTACRLARVIKNYGIEDWGPSDVDYPALHRALASIRSSPPCPGCLKGGGRTDCEMRACATKRHLRECSDCASFEDCPNQRLRDHMRSGALRVGMIVKEKKGARSDFLREARAELRRRDKER